MVDRLQTAGKNYATSVAKGQGKQWAANALAQQFPETLGPTPSMVANAAAGEAPATVLGSSLGALGGVGGLYGAYQLSKGYGAGIKDWKTNAMRTAAGGLSGMGIAAGVNGVAALAGFAPLMGLGPIGIAVALAALGSGMIKAGKSKEQMSRDFSRTLLQKAGVADDKYNVKLANGQTANIGGDGQSTFVGQDGKTYKQGYQSDWSNPLTGEAVQYGSLINALTRGPQDQDLSDKGAVTTNLINAFTTGAKSKEDVAANFKAAMSGSQISGRDAWRQVGDMVNSKQISLDQGTIYHNALKNIYGQDYEKWGADAGEDHMGPVEPGPVPAPVAAVNRTPAKSRRKQPAANPTPAPTTPVPVVPQQPTILPGPNALMTMPQAMTPEQEAEALARVSAQNQRRT